MPSVLWAAIVHGPDAEVMGGHLSAVTAQSTQPSKVLVIDSGHCESIRRIAETFGSICEYCFLDENLGFNAGLNRAVDEAVKLGYDWLATMTVRARPTHSWLSEALYAGERDDIGMVTTLHLGEAAKVDCFGHCLGTEGQLFSYGEGLKAQDLKELPLLRRTGAPAIWSPCSGGAMYKTAALNSARALTKNRDLVRPRGFKSYNCDVLGYLIRASGYLNSLSVGAICTRRQAGSSSKTPDTPGLLMNQEINRIANIFEFWPDARRRHAITEYLKDNRLKDGLRPVDLRIARTLGEALARPDLNKTVGGRIQIELDEHLDLFADLKAKRKTLLTNSGVV